jgi:hypothetical protein
LLFFYFILPVGGIKKSSRYFGSSQAFVQGTAALFKACSKALSLNPQNIVRARNVWIRFTTPLFQALGGGWWHHADLSNSENTKT